MFRRRRRDVEDAERLGPGYGTDDDAEDYGDPGDQEDYEDLEDGDGPEPEPSGLGQAGPWDAADGYQQRARLDFGSLLVPAGDEFEIRINVADETTGVSVDILRGDLARGGSGLQLQAFAAPKSSGLWDEVRQEIAEEVAKSGGRSQETQGPFGPELHALVGGAGRRQLEPSRFLGVDGPRWFLRGVITGPAASHREQARPFEELFADVVVVRGDHPAPPRELLILRLPEDAQRMEEAEDQEPLRYPDPYDRGPEITEIR